MTYRAMLPLHHYAQRLGRIFPRDAFDTVLSAPAAGAAVAAMVYVNAVVDDDAGPPFATVRWARPSMCLWFSENAYHRQDAGSRTAWYEAALSGKAKERVTALHASWGSDFQPLYGDNTRETVRDEAFRAWLGHGALRRKPGMPTTSPLPRWALTSSFADLFHPSLQGDRLTAAINHWRDAHMTPGARLKALMVQERSQTSTMIPVMLPNGVVRSLEPGEASVILKGVIEHWAPARLMDPVVVTVSEPGDKVYVADHAILSRLGLRIDVTSLLPDAVLVDIGPSAPIFWMVEAVRSDGPIDEARKGALLDWARDQGIPEGGCEFLTAFGSRSSGAARRRLKDLAAGTYAWYADEPAHELAWYEL